MKKNKTLLFAALLVATTLPRVCGAAPAAVRAFEAGYTSAEPFAVTLTLGNPDNTGLNALYLQETIPDGWTLAAGSLQISDDGGREPLHATAPGSLEILWLAMPTNFPVTVAYKLNVPAGENGAKTFSGELDWALYGEAQTVTTAGASEVISDQYVQTPAIIPAGGTFASNQVVEITCATPDALIYYTTDGSTPSDTSGTLYAGPFEITASCTVKARGFHSGKEPGATASATFRQALAYDDVQLSIGVRMEQKLADLGVLPAKPTLAKTSKTALPSGLKLEIRQDAATGAYSVWLVGIPTRVNAAPAAVSYEARVKVKENGKTVTKVLTTIDMTFPAVAALPAPVPATYNGWLASDDGCLGALSLTASAKGLLSGKLGYLGTNYTFKAAAFDAKTNGTFYAAVDVKYSRTILGTLRLAIDSTGGVTAELAGTAMTAALARNNWADANMAAWGNTALEGYYTLQLPVAGPAADPCGSGYMTVTLGRRGAAKWAGKLADGQGFSGSGTLVYLDAAGLFLPVAASYGSKKGYFCTVLTLTPGADKTGNTFAGANALWRNTDFKSVWTDGSLDLQAAPATGFHRQLKATGGYYNKTTDFANHYLGRALSIGNDPVALELPYTYTKADRTKETRYAAPVLGGIDPFLPVNATASGLAMTAKSTLKKQPDGTYNYATATNPAAATFKFARGTGIFTGSFKIYYDYQAREGAPAVTHAAKAVKVAGILTPVRATLGGLATDEGAGYCLLNLGDKCSYTDAKGKPKTYTFGKWSYVFTLEAQ